MIKKKTKSKEVDLSGSEFFVTEMEKRLLDELLKQREHAEMGLDYFSAALSDSRDKFWKLLYELYPEWKGYHSNFNMIEGKIHLIRKKLRVRKEAAK